ncbi:MAG: GGDEF-domain containing protein, partial [Alphaproteobacteria bacterium]|nr:GGDEF-domain containing protein [Alphaproteobacteria bacterium]
DGSLIASITEDEVARDLLLGVLQLCRAIGSPVTAEMVETHEHLCLLETMGVDSLQGYYFGMPMRAEAVAPFLAGQACHPLRLAERSGALPVGA